MRLFAQIFLIVASSAMVAALAMAGLTSLSLSRGFEAYLRDRDNQRLDEFVAEAEALIAADPDAGLAQVVALIPDPRPDARPRGEQKELPETLPPAEAEQAAIGQTGDPPADAQLPRPPPGFLPRLSIYDLEGRRLAGPPLRETTRGAIRRPIMGSAQMVGEVVLIPIGPSPEGIETDFLRDQFTGMAVLLILILALAAATAFLVARHGTKVLSDIRNVTSHVAKGDFSKRATVNGNGEIATLAHNINEMTHKLGDLQQARRTWLAEVGHELRTPMTILQGELEALREGIRPLTQAAIRSLDEEIHRLSLLVDDLQFMALSDVSRPTFSYAPMSISQVFGTAEQRFSEQCRVGGYTLCIENTVPDSMLVFWDEHRIEQLLANLISNSLAYTDAPGRIQLRAIPTLKSIKLVIEDSAPGVAPEDMGKLFDPLFRAEKSRARNLGGSGLGLAICSVIVEEHNGSIEAEPSKIGGLKIVVTLPVRHTQSVNRPGEHK